MSMPPRCRIQHHTSRLFLLLRHSLLAEGEHREIISPDRGIIELAALLHKSTLQSQQQHNNICV